MAASAVEDGFVKDTVFSGLTAPTKVRFAPDGRVFVAQQDGLVLEYDSLEDATPTTYADLRDEVAFFGDRGLLGMALDPRFDSGRPYVYVLYTRDAKIGGSAPLWNDNCPDPPGLDVDGCVVSGTLSRLDENGTEHILIKDEWCQQYSSHSMGDLNFGPDGALYASAGDGASFVFADYGQDGTPRNPCGDPPGGVGGAMTPPTAEGGSLRSQDLRTSGDPTGLNGSVIRVDPDTGQPLASNPGTGDLNARRIVAYGLRNPFRWTFRPGTTDLYVGDVGLYQYEEINRSPAPTTTVKNFGWPCYEGANEHLTWYYLNVNICKNLYADGSATAPLYYYGHNEKVAGERCQINGSSISALTFYDGGSFPSEYKGALFFGDYSRSCIWVMFPDANGVPDPATRVPFDEDAGYPVDLEVGPGGDLYYVDIAEGKIVRVSAVDSNEAPTAVATSDVSTGPKPLTVHFNGAESSDPNGDTLTYAWDLDGDGAYDDSSAIAPTWTYTSNGSVAVKLKVTDPSGLTSIDQLAIVVGSPPVAHITSPTAGNSYKVGDTVSFSGGAVDGDGQPMPASRLVWTIEIHHCYALAPTNCHTHLIQTLTGAAASSMSFPDHDFPSYVTLTLRATDGDGLTGTDVVRIDPKTVDVSFRSEPAGVPLTIGGETQAAPFSRTVIQNGTTGVSAPLQQTINGQVYDFASWSQGGAAAQQLQIPATPTTYTATYVPSPCATKAGLVGAWGFDEASGTAVSDSSGNNNNGTINGATRTTDGRFGGALTFNGTSNSVTVPDSNSLDLTSGMTLEAWVNPTAGGGSYGWHQAIMKERPAGMAYALYSTADNGKPSAHAFTTSERQAHSSATLANNTWTHIAATYDGTNVRVWVNGVDTGSATASPPIVTSTGNLRFGGNSIWGEWFTGRMDEVRIYNRALSQAEIQATMTKPVGCAATPPTLSVGPSSLSFSAVRGGSDPVTQTLAVTNTGGGTLSYTAVADQPWLTVAPASGAAPATLTVKAAVGSLAAGTYTGNVTVTSSGATGSPKTIPVTFTVSEPPKLTVAPTSLSFSDATAKTVAITNSGGGSLTYTATDDAAWLTVAPSSGTAPGSITVTPSLSGLAPGTYTATVTVTAAGATGSPATIPVTLTVPGLGVAPTALTFNDATPKTLDVSNTGGGTLSFSVSKDASWLTVSPTSGTAPRTLTVTPSLSGLAPGTYTAAITITAGSLVKTVPVTLTVPGLGVAPSALSFSAVEGQGPPADRTLNVSNTGGGSLAYTASDEASWLAVTPASGSAPQALTVSVTTTGMTAGTYTGHVTVTAPGAVGSPVSVTVTLVVDPPPAPPELGVTPASLSFHAVQGQASPAAKTLSVANLGTGSLAFTTSSDALWLAVSPAAGSAPGTLTLTPATAALPAGDYTATVTVSAPGVLGAPKAIPVTLTVDSPPPVLALSTGTLSFSDATPQTVDVTNAGGGSLAFSVSDDAAWLDVSPPSGTAPETLSATPSLDGLAPGAHHATITVSSAAGDKTVAVTLTVPEPPAVLAVAPASLSFSDASPKTLAVGNDGGGTLDFTASADAGWLTVSPGSGSAPGTVTVTPSFAGLTPGTHTATVTIESAAGTKTVAVSADVPEAGPELALSPASLSFSSQAPQTIAVSNAGGGSLSFSASSDAAWLDVTPQSGGAPDTLTVTPSFDGLTPGAHHATITVSSDGGTKTVAVTATVHEPPAVLAVAPSSLSFSDGTPKSLSVTNDGGGTLAYTASSDQPWLTVSPLSGSAPATLTVTPLLGGLTPGIHTATVTISSDAGTKTVPVSLTVPEPPPALAVAPASLSFSGTAGAANPAAKTLDVSNAGGGTLTFSVSKDASWLTVTPTTGTAPQALTVTPSLSGVSAGTYAATITVTAGSQVKTVPVSLTVAAPPTLSVSPASVGFSATAGGADPATQALSITNSGSGSLRYTVSDDAAWLSESPASGSAPGSVTLSATIGALAAGTYTATVTVTGNGGTKTVPVTLTVASASVPGLVGAWGFDEAAGSTVVDRSGNNNMGTIEGATRIATGKYGPALQFDGLSSRVTVPGTPSLTLSNQVTMEAWVYPTNGAGVFRSILFREQANAISYGLYANTSTSRPSVNIHTTSEQELRGNAALTLNAWNHVAATWDGTTVRLYVNGVQKTTRALSGTMASTTAPLRFGANGPWGEYFAGRLDEIRIYNRALTAAQITSDMNTAVNP